jgi:hypothetical protein
VCVLSERVEVSAEVRLEARPAGRVEPPDHTAAGAPMFTVWVSFRSTSVKLSVADDVSAAAEPVVFATSVTAWLATASATTTGTSLVPVAVKVTGWTDVAPWLSVTVML